MKPARTLILLAALGALAPAALAADGPATLPEALEQASARGTLVLVDFFSET